MTPKERAAMQQALEALELHLNGCGVAIATRIAYEALGKALAEQAEQEIIPSWEEYCECEGIPCEPVKPVNLTDDEIDELWLTHGQGQMMYIHEKFARAVIAADREKNK